MLLARRTASIVVAAAIAAFVACGPATDIAQAEGVASSYHGVEPVGPYGETIPLSALGKQSIGLSVQAVQKVPLPLLIQVPGKIEAIPTRNYDQHAPLSGRITAVDVWLGEIIKAGDIICTVESPDMNQLAAQLLQQKTELEADYDKQKADLDEEVSQAEAKLELAQAAYKRALKLASERIAAQRDVEITKADISVTEMRLKTAKQNREVILKAAREKIPLTLRPLRQQLKMLGVDENRIERMVQEGTTETSVPVRSARSGAVSDLKASAGQSIDPNDQLCTVTDLTRVWATANVYEDDMSRMHVGQKVHIRVPALGAQRIDGQLTYIGTQVDVSTRTLPVRAEIDNPRLAMKPDMFAELSIETGAPGYSILLPRDAVVQRLGHTLVFVESKNGYQPYSVRLGRSFGDNVEITEGLNPGQKVVVRGAFQLGAELLQVQGGGSMFQQPTEGGDRFSEEHGDERPTGMTVTPLGIGVVIAAAFLFGFVVAALFARRASLQQRFSRPGDGSSVIGGGNGASAANDLESGRAGTKHGGADD